MKLECTMLFQSNPYMVESAEGISKQLKASVEEILPILEQLLAQGIITQVEKGATPRYRYSEPVIITDINKQDELKNT